MTGSSPGDYKSASGLLHRLWSRMTGTPTDAREPRHGQSEEAFGWRDETRVPDAAGGEGETVPDERSPSGPPALDPPDQSGTGRQGGLRPDVPIEGADVPTPPAPMPPRITPQPELHPTVAVRPPNDLELHSHGTLDPTQQPFVPDRFTPEAQRSPYTTPGHEPQPVDQGTPTSEPQPIPQGTPVPQPQPVDQGTPTPEPQPIPQGTPVPQPQPVDQGTPTPEPDRPAMIGGNDAGQVTEDLDVIQGDLITFGVLDITDPDAGEAIFVPHTDISGSYGSFALAVDGALDLQCVEQSVRDTGAWRG